MDGIGGASGGGSDSSNTNMERLLGALAMLMEQQRAQPIGGQSSTKALKGIVDKIGRFDGKDITSFLRVYLCEMEVHQVPEDRMVETFGLAVVPEIRERIREIIEDEAVTSWAIFEERLRDEYFDEDSERITKRSFLDWVEKQPGNGIGPNELLREFEKKYSQLPMAERRLLDTRKAELFLQAADAALEDRLLLLLGDRTTEGGFTNDWRRIEETVTLIAKQRRVKSRGAVTRAEATYVPAQKPSKTPASSITQPSASKPIEGDALDELIKGFKELKVEMSELRKSRTSNSSQPSDGGRKFVKRCLWCDKEEDHNLRGCMPLDEALKEGIVHFKDGKIHDKATDLPIPTNFGKGGMKKLMEDKSGRFSGLHAQSTEAFAIEVDCHPVEVKLTPCVETLKRGAQAIRKATGWEDPVDAISIRAFLGEEQSDNEQHEASVEEKRGRAADEGDVEGPANKKKPSSNKDTTSKEGPAANTRQKREPAPYPGENTPLPKDKWEERMDNQKRKGKEAEAKGKSKTPAYKLQSDIESSIDLKGVLEERILDAKIEFTLREALGIAKKDFHELIIDIIKRKRQMTADTVMVEALDTLMTEDEEEEIGQVFALMCDPKTKKEETVGGGCAKEVEFCLTDEEEDEILHMFAEGHTIDVKKDVSKPEGLLKFHGMADEELEGVDKLKKTTKSPKALDKKKNKVEKEDIVATFEERTTTEANTFECGIVHSLEGESEEKVDYFLPFWARATTETRVKLGQMDDPVLALVDHGSEINIMSRSVYEKGKWPIDTNHGWVMRSANSGRTHLYGACPAVSAKIGDVEVEQNFFVQNQGAYPVILGQPYITASRMETKVLDDGSHYARIRSLDGKKSVQFLTVRSENERHRVQLRDGPLPTSLTFSDF